MTHVLRPYLELVRAGNLPTVWTNVLTAAVLSGSGWSWGSVALLAAAMSLVYCGGMVLNDLWDAPVDRVERPERPIPSGRVSGRVAAVLAAVLLGGGAGLLWGAPHRAGFGAGLVLVGAVVAYDRFHKGLPWSVFVMAGCRFLVFVVAGLGIAGCLRGPVLLAGLVQYLYVLALSAAARLPEGRRESLHIPGVPALIAGVSLVDGAVLLLLAGGGWWLAGAAGAGLAWVGNRWVPGD